MFMNYSRILFRSVQELILEFLAGEMLLIKRYLNSPNIFRFFKEKSHYVKLLNEKIHTKLTWKFALASFYWNVFFYSLPNDKIVDQSKMKGFVDDKMNVTQKLNLFYEV